MSHRLARLLKTRCSLIKNIAVAFKLEDSKYCYLYFCPGMCTKCVTKAWSYTEMGSGEPQNCFHYKQDMSGTW